MRYLMYHLVFAPIVVGVYCAFLVRPGSIKHRGKLLSVIVAAALGLAILQASVIAGTEAYRRRFSGAALALKEAGAVQVATAQAHADTAQSPMTRSKAAREAAPRGPIPRAG